MEKYTNQMVWLMVLLNSVKDKITINKTVNKKIESLTPDGVVNGIS